MGFWGLNSWFVHVRKALYQLTRLHFQPTLYELEVAGNLLCCMGGMEAGHGGVEEVWEKGRVLFPTSGCLSGKKTMAFFRKGWWLNRNEAIENLDPTVPPVTCTATTPPVPSCTRGGCHHHLVNSKHEFAVALRGCPVMAAHLC